MARYYDFADINENTFANVNDNDIQEIKTAVSKIVAIASEYNKSGKDDIIRYVCLDLLESSGTRYESGCELCGM